MSIRKKDLTPNQLQVYLHAEKQESWYVFLFLLSAGAIAASIFPSFAVIYGTYGGLLLTSLGALFGVNIAHKMLNKTTK